MSKLFLLGAGASFGSDSHYTPPLGAGLFDSLRRFNPDGWGTVAGSLADSFRADFESAMKAETKQPPFILTNPMRRIVELAITELCERRGYGLSAVNVRTNHAHAVVSAQTKPERIVDALKANATKLLRENCLFLSKLKYGHEGEAAAIYGNQNMLAVRSITFSIVKAMFRLTCLIDGYFVRASAFSGFL